VPVAEGKWDGKWSDVKMGIAGMKRGKSTCILCLMLRLSASNKAVIFESILRNEIG
jgi:hypothetical protein